MVKKAQTGFGSLQNPDQPTNVVVVHSSFSPDGGNSYVIVTPGADRHRLRVFDTATGTLKNDYEEEEGDGKWSCVRWGSIVETGGANGAAKKKRKSAATGGSQSQVLALGHNDGSISIYSLAHGRVVHQLSGSHTGRVNDFSFASSGTKGFSAGEDGLVCEWDIAQGVEMSKFQADQKAVKKIQLNHQETMVLTAGHSMKLWSLDTRDLIKTFTGHASAITNIVFSPDDAFVASTAEQDRFINLWDATRESQQEGNITALTLDNTVTHVDISANHAVLAISEEGTAGLWQNAQSPSGGASSTGSKSSKKKRFTTRASDLVIRIKSSKGENTVIPVLGGLFTQQDGQVIMARGSTIKPVFEKIEFQKEDGSLKEEKEMVLVRAPVTGFLIDESAQALQNVQATKRGYDESSVTVVGTSDFALATPSMAMDADSDDEEGEGAKDHQAELEGRTMEEKLQDLAVEDSTGAGKASSKAKSSKNKYPTPKANSLQQMLIQALHSNDLQLLEACLTFNNVEVIRNTVRRLPTTYVIPFLTQVIHKFQQKPNRGEALLEWIKAVLLIHTAYLMTVPDLIKKLSNFYQTLDSRVSVYSRLLNLQGRLDLVMSQIEMRQQYEAEDTTNEASTVYVEEDDEDEDDDEMGEDEDEDDDLVGEADAFDDDDDESGSDEEDLESDMSDDDGEDDEDEEDEFADLL
ncbi:WD repeat-containing protein 43 [Actinomortierella ambigua]|uniref:WD repeat-containing protein 43 n=1 Tax=Actinomortierella ambigua TaxID=1343610 RepID=A0A9P6Q6W1_9FUNG|nr:WD repeat-containing protein 43 [Actinomortierella ambigua]